MKRIAIFATLVGVGLVAYWLGMPLLLGGAEVPPNESKVVQAERAFKLQSYNEAIRVARAYLATNPPRADVEKMTRIIGLSQINLRQYPAGQKTLLDLVQSYPAQERDAEVMAAITQAKFIQEWNPLEVAKWAEKAISLYAAADDTRKQLDLLFRLAEYFEQRMYNFRFEEQVRDQRHTVLGAVIKILEVYDRALKLGGKMDDQVRALAGKARILRNQYHSLSTLPRTQWPSFARTTEDLSKPIELAHRFEREITQRFPQHLGAATAWLRIGDDRQHFQRDFVAALKDYEELVKTYPRSPEAKGARERMREINTPLLSIQVPEVFLPNDKVEFSWSARNLKKVKFAAYPVDLFELIKKVDNFQHIDRYPLPGWPIMQWELDTGDTDKHEFLGNHQKPAPMPLKEGNAYIVTANATAADKSKVRTTVLVVVSRLGMLAKMVKDRLVLLAVDAVTGKPLHNTDLLVQRHVRTGNIPLLNISREIYAYDQHRLGDSGMSDLRVPKGEDGGHRHPLVIARQGTNFAIVSNPYYQGYWWTLPNNHRVYCFTERPVYRPGQTVHFKHIVREYRDGAYHNVAGNKVKVTIRDARGQTAYEKELIANGEGSLSGSFSLPSNATLGMYNTQLDLGGNRQLEMNPGASFRVEEYKKPEYEVTITTPKPSYKVGEELEVVIRGDYYFGGGVPNAKVQYTVYREEFSYNPSWPQPFDWFFANDSSEEQQGFGMRRWMPPSRRDLVHRGETTTNDAGVAMIKVQTKAFEQTPRADLQYRIEARMVDQSRREIVSTKVIKVTHQAYYLSLRPQQRLYQPGDRVRIQCKAETPNGRPLAIAGKLKISYVAQREDRDDQGTIKTPERLEELTQRDFSVDADGENDFTFDADRKGLFRVDVTAPDPFGEKVTGTAYLWVAQGHGELAHYAHRDLEIELDRDTFQAGQTARVLLTTKHQEAYALMTAEADDIYWARMIYIPKNSTTLELPILPTFRPNVHLKVALFRDNQVYFVERALKVPPVEQFLNVKLLASKKEFLPRESATIDVEVTDNKGQPVACEMAVGAVDSSVFYIQEETRGDIRKFFHGRQRPLAVQTQTSYEFRFFAREEMDRSSFRYSRRGGNVGALGGVGGGMGGGLGYSERRASRSPQGAVFAEAAMADAAPAPKGMAPGMEMAAPQAANRALATREKGKRADEVMAEATVRSEFPDTVVWMAHVTTGADGKANVKVRFPDSLTTWRLTAIGANRDTAVGEAKVELITRKNILVRLQAPRFFVENDQVILSAIAHNYLAKEKKVRVRMELSPELAFSTPGSPSELQGTPSEVTVTVPPGGEKRVDFSTRAVRPGKARVLAKALTDEESDAVQMEYPVLEYGTEKLLAESGILRALPDTDVAATVRIAIPDQIRPGSQMLSVRVSPTIANIMLESLPYLLQYPYGCTEQTMSRFVPAVLAANTLRKLGLDLGALRDLPKNDPVVQKRLRQFQNNPVYDAKELDAIVEAGVKRLQDFQASDGGWGWWKGDHSNPYLTSYVVSGLALAADAGVKLPPNMLERGATFLAQRVVQAEPVTQHPWLRAENKSARVYMLYALGEANRAKLRDPKIREQLQEVYRRRDDLNDYSRALAVLTLNAAGMREQADILLANLKDRAQVDNDNNTASWGDYDGYYYWYQCGTEATSYSLKALMTMEPNSPLIPKIVNWLLRHRRGTQWFNTKDTATVCYVLADYLQITKELEPELTITMDIDGRATKTIRVSRQNLFTLDGELQLSAAELGTGVKNISVRCQGKGSVYWGVHSTFFTKESKIAPAAHEIAIERAYYRMVPREVESTRTVFDPASRKQKTEKFRRVVYDRKRLTEGETLRSGDLIDVELTVHAKNNFEYLLFEDPKPAGCEAVNLKSGYSWEGGLPGHREYRDQKLAIFTTYLNQGKHQFSYRLRAEIPGTFHALPARAECMYAPLVRGNAASYQVKVTD